WANFGAVSQLRCNTASHSDLLRRSISVGEQCLDHVAGVVYGPSCEDREIGGAVIIEIDIEFSKSLQNCIARGENHLCMALGRSTDGGPGSQGIKPQAAIKLLRHGFVFSDLLTG